MSDPHFPQRPLVVRDGNDAPTDEELSRLQFSTLLYYLHESHPIDGMVRDKTDLDAPVNIAAVGMAPASIPVVVERKVLIRSFAAKFSRRQLQFLHELPQGPEPNASGYKGFFYYHFLDIESGRRVWQCELSDRFGISVRRRPDGATYFDDDTEDEAAIRRLANALYSRADWNWARNGEATLTHGWRPENGFIPHCYEGYDEGLLLYILGMGSPTYALPPESYGAYCATYQWKSIYGRELLYCGPLFTHQLSHLWIDFRGLRDAFMQERGSDYFENSREATFVQQEYAIRNPLECEGYGRHCWGFTACDGPGNVKRTINGVERQFYDYIPRGAPYGPDDGTIAPWVVVASLPFAPEIVIPTLRHFAQMDVGSDLPYGFKPSFNQTYSVDDSPTGWWISPYHFGIDQGPVILMIENYRTELIWNLSRRCPPIVAGLRRAGFRGGWLT